jgi:multimeric flavodoxin WrbA
MRRTRMRVTILNGEPEASTPFDEYVRAVAAQLESHGHNVTTIDLRELDIRQCAGCWGCWVKTPGECVAHDASALVCREAVNSDLAIFASPLAMGFPTALLKRTMDKLIPLVHPYIVIDHGEMHHRHRYEHYPQIGLIVGPEPDTDEGDLEIVFGTWERLSRNFKSELAFALVADTPAEEVADVVAAAA